MLIKFKKNYIKLIRNNNSYDTLDNSNVFFRALVILFFEYGGTSWFKKDLLNLRYMNIEGDENNIIYTDDVVFLKPAWVHRTSSTDYKVKVLRCSLLGLANEWENLVKQKVPSFYIMCINGEYCMREELSENIEQQNNVRETSITFAQNYIELNKSSNGYIIQENGNYFLMRLAMLFNDSGPSTNWFRDFLLPSADIAVEGMLTQLENAQNIVTTQPSQVTADYINNCPIEIDCIDLLRLTREWDNLVVRGIEQIFIIFKDNRYAVVEQLPEDIVYHIKGKCFCDMCDDY